MLHNDIKTALDKLPYGFVEVPDADPILEDMIPLDQLDEKNLYTGEMKCSIFALNHLCVGNCQKKPDDGPIEIHPLEVNGKILIPESTLKGCIANFMAANLGYKMNRVNDHHYSFRPNTKFGPGVLNKVGEIVTLPTPASPFYHIRAFRETQFAFVKSNHTRPYINGNYQWQVDPRNRNKLRITGIGGTTRFVFKNIRDGLDGTGYFAKAHAEFFNLNYPPVHDKIGIRTDTHGDLAYETEPASVKPKLYTIASDIYQIYQNTAKILSDSKQGHLADHPLLHNEPHRSHIVHLTDQIPKNWNLQAGDIIFFEHQVKRNEILTFGKHFRYRWGYSRSIRDFTKDIGIQDDYASTPPKLTVISEIFGYSSDDKNIPHEKRAKSAKVHFTYAVHEKSSGKEGQLLLPRPGSPRPSSYEFYLRQNLKGPGSLITYGDPARADIRTANMPRLSGFKNYRRSLVKPPDGTGSHNDAIKLPKVLLPDTVDGKSNYPKFQLAVRFENMRYCELVQLVQILTLLDNRQPEEISDIQSAIKNGNIHCHQIGYGKNYGMGAIRFRIQNITRFKYTGTGFEDIPMDVATMMNDKNSTIRPELLRFSTLSPTSFMYPEEADNHGNLTIFNWHTNVKNEDLRLRRQ
jgi:hypothetical protein